MPAVINVPAPYGCVVAEHFVSVGQEGEAGQDIVMIEAMKMYNPVATPEAGTVTWLETPGVCAEEGATIAIIARRS